MEYCIEVKNLTKKYDDFVAVDNVSYQIKKGICLAILGPNGAGKTTFMEMIEGIKARTSGEISILGLSPDKDISKIQPKMGVQLQENNYFDYLSLENLCKFFIAMYPGSKATPASLLDLVGLAEKKKQAYAKLSGGQKQRFSIAIALVNDPEIVFLDEPTTGLDPQNRQYIWDLVTQFKKNNKTVILTTHYMEEADKLADEIIIMDHAKIVEKGTSQELKRKIKGTSSITISVGDENLAESDLKAIAGIEEYKELSGSQGWKVWTSDLVNTIRNIYSYADSKNISITHIEIGQVTLEDVFLSLTGRALRE